MQRTCDICGDREATLFESVIIDNNPVEYGYCRECYENALKCGKNPHEEANFRLSRRDKECKICGYTVEDFEKNFLFGCANCYSQMRKIAIEAASNAQGVNAEFLHAHAPKNTVSTILDLKGAHGAYEDGNCNRSGNSERFGESDSQSRPSGELSHSNGELSRSSGFQSRPNGELLKSAKDCTINELVKNNVVSSRVRLARNVTGLEFPRNIKTTDQRVVDLMNGAYAAAQGVFEARLLPMNKLKKEQKKALIERHLISLALANNTQNGAAIFEGDKKFGISVMINEEDHIREQCVEEGFNLKRAYERLRVYDERLLHTLPIAYDSQLGFLTACPTNLGTGMRASCMLFLPALKRAGAIEDALKTFKSEFGLTVRGVYGEGSEAAYDMYQISNSLTLGVSEDEIISQVEQAVVRMCYCERVALEKLVKERQTELLDGISRSYAVLKGAYALTAQELMKLLVDVKIGVILGILPIKSTAITDEMIWACSASSLQILTNGSSEEESDKMRARIVRELLAEEK